MASLAVDLVSPNGGDDAAAGVGTFLARACGGRSPDFEGQGAATGRREARAKTCGASAHSRRRHISARGTHERSRLGGSSSVGRVSPEREPVLRARSRGFHGLSPCRSGNARGPPPESPRGTGSGPAAVAAGWTASPSDAGPPTSQRDLGRRRIAPPQPAPASRSCRVGVGGHCTAVDADTFAPSQRAKRVRQPEPCAVSREIRGFRVGSVSRTSERSGAARGGLSGRRYGTSGLPPNSLTRVAWRRRLGAGAGRGPAW